MTTTHMQLIGPHKAAFLHWEWVSRQYIVFVQLLQASSLGTSILQPTSGMSGPPVIELEQQPGYYYQLAAHYMRERRNSFRLL